MRFFSERFGLAQANPPLQIEAMDDSLRVALWNCLTEHVWHQADTDRYGYGPRRVYASDELNDFVRTFWTLYLKRPLDTLPPWEEAHREIRGYYFGAAWNEVYDFLEFAVRGFPDASTSGALRRSLNHALERENSGYRFVGGRLAAITSPAELAAIEAATSGPEPMAVVRQQLASAVAKLTDRKAPDFRNSIKESISAVESVCALITGQEKADLNAALRTLEKRVALHGALRSAFNSLYGYTSDAEGIRHALLDESNLTFDDAKFMLVVCSAFVNYVIALLARTAPER